MAKKPRVKVPKSAKKGDIIEIKTLISHKMETGTRKNKKTGKLIPRFIINKFAVVYGGGEIFSADMYPAIAANPYFAFFARATSSGSFDFTWTDDKGKSVKASKKISVS